MKYTKAELLALDPEPYPGKIDFVSCPPKPCNVLWVQFDGCRYYNLEYVGGGKNGVFVHNWSDIPPEVQHG